MAYDITAATTGASLATLSASDVRQLYSQVLTLGEQEGDFWQEFEGRGEDNIIVTKTDTSKGAGQKIRFTVTNSFHHQGRVADEQFDDSEMFESFKPAGFDLQVDWIRNAVSINKRAEEYMGLRGELTSKMPENLSKWLGRKKTFLLDKTFLLRSDARNIFYANGKQAEADLRPSDFLNVNQVIELKAELNRVGAAPAMVGNAGKNKVHKYILVSTEDGLVRMKQSDAYQNLLKAAEQRGSYNPLFKGGYVDLDGQVIKERVTLDHDSNGPIGSTMNPRASLGVAITAGTATFSIKGGGNATNAAEKYTPHFQAFPDYPVTFTSDDTVAAGTASFYVVIRNNSGADRGKWGFYKCNANSWSSSLNVLTVEERLGSADETIATTNVRDNVVGNVTWNADVNTDAHPEGSTIILTNASACPIGYSLMLGRRAAFRGYGMFRNNMDSEVKEGSSPATAFITRRFIQSVFGQCLPKDLLARKIGHLVLWHAIYPGFDVEPTLVA